MYLNFFSLYFRFSKLCVKHCISIEEISLYGKFLFLCLVPKLDKDIRIYPPWYFPIFLLVYAVDLIQKRVTA